MRALSILICSSDEPAMQKMATLLASDGVSVQTSTRLVDSFRPPDRELDVLLIDLDGLNSFLRSILPSFCQSFPNLPIVGISTRSDMDSFVAGLTPDLRLDAHVFEIPKPEELIVSFPQVAAKYLFDPGNLPPLEAKPLAN